MTAGIRVLGDHGFAQIDQDYQNMALRHTGTITNSAYIGTQAFNSSVQILYSHKITVAAVKPVVAMRPLGSSSMGVLCWGTVDVGGGNWDIYFWTTTGNGAHSFQWYVFDEPQTPGSHNGFAVFRSDGSLAFSGGLKYMRINGSLTPGSGRELAGMHTKKAGNWSFVDVATVPATRYWQQTRQFWRRNTSTGVLSLASFVTNELLVTGADPTFSNSNKAGGTLAIDVTGY